MWFVGMIVGAVIGAMGRFESAVIGGIVGAFVGGLLSGKSKKGAADTRVAALEESVRKLTERVQALEGGVVAAPATDAAVASNVQTGDAVQIALLPVPEVPVPVVATSQPVASTMDVAEPSAPAPALSKPMGAPPKSSKPQEPSALWNFFFGGNTLVRVGILVLFIGVSFLLKYAADAGFVPIELRLAGVAAGGIALLVLGWRLRHKREGYALMLQGGGVGILYLTVFAALRLYHLVPPTLAFFLLAGMAFFSALLAIAQDSKALAITGAVGGFLAPILASTGGGSHVALFSFYAVLNAGILFIAWFKAWRELNLVGFAFTALIGLAWGSDRYRPDFFATTEPFLILFFLMYVAIAVLFAQRQAPKLTHYVDGTIVFGVPLVAFGMQAAMVKPMEFGAAFSALAVAAFYLILATILNAKKRDSLRLLVESFLALGIGFATLAVPLALDGRWTSAVWAVEGAAIVWVGVRQNRLLARAFGMLLQIAAGLSFLAHDNHVAGPEHLLPVLNASYLGCVMVSVAALFINAYASRRRDVISDNELLATRALFIWGVLWWLVGGILEIERHVSGRAAWNPELIFFAGSCAVFAALWKRLDWREARYAALILLPLMAGTLLGIAGDNVRHPFAYYGYTGWIIAFAAHLSVLRMHRASEYENVKWLDWYHAAGFWLLAIVASWEFGWQIDHYVEGRRVWPLIAWAVVPGALIAVFASRGAWLGWPVSERQRGYLYLGALPLAVFLLGWIVIANFISNGNPDPLPYVPLLNPLDLAQFGALLALATWYLLVRRMELSGAKLPATKTALVILGIVLFVALNGVLLRTLHHYADVPFRFNRMMSSTLVQASFSLFWSLLALGAMFFANKRGLRALWFVGAVLLAVVIGKLALVDLSNTGTVERIVSFIGVGLFCVVIGYFAPVPPKQKNEAQGEKVEEGV
ncbi:MAG: DUF2339 domain-containing protein [Burkholderiales bacterium]